MFAGTSARLDASQIKSNSGWNVITNWDFKSARSKPGIFMKGKKISCVLIIDRIGDKAPRILNLHRQPWPFPNIFH